MHDFLGQPCFPPFADGPEGWTGPETPAPEFHPSPQMAPPGLSAEAREWADALRQPRVWLRDSTQHAGLMKLLGNLLPALPQWPSNAGVFFETGGRERKHRSPPGHASQLIFRRAQSALHETGTFSARVQTTEGVTIARTPFYADSPDGWFMTAAAGLHLLQQDGSPAPCHHDRASAALRLREELVATLVNQPVVCNHAAMTFPLRRSAEPVNVHWPSNCEFGRPAAHGAALPAFLSSSPSPSLTPSLTPTLLPSAAPSSAPWLSPEAVLQAAASRWMPANSTYDVHKLGHLSLKARAWVSLMHVRGCWCSEDSQHLELVQALSVALTRLTGLPPGGVEVVRREGLLQTTRITVPVRAKPEPCIVVVSGLAPQRHMRFARTGMLPLAACAQDRAVRVPLFADATESFFMAAMSGEAGRWLHSKFNLPARHDAALSALRIRLVDVIAQDEPWCEQLAATVPLQLY